ncbi:hypothetical protein GP486_005872 [Trichoglossum hirsutum]|uniref:Sec39 domain-containing protein n=1 Tax=Trichoglossum hirsutum TaxID=265104 RepID=A0A9P8L8E1_9PEZI|nr:hypothetical protein GP486_005872 [Trichoglossum hirsutum]
MAGPAELSPAKAVLLAARFTADSNILALQALATLHQDTLRLRLILRLLLTFLPESTHPSLYVPFVQELASGSFARDDAIAELDCSSVEDLTDAEARKRVRKLHLVDLYAPPIDLQPVSDDITLFLIDRAHRVDEQTGLLTLLPQLVVPFLDHSEYLRSWFISTVLPLLRFSYEYYPQEGAIFSLAAFEGLGEQAGVGVLLSRSGSVGNDEVGGIARVGRDLRGLVGPWMYGDTRSKRRKLSGELSSGSLPSIHAVEMTKQEAPGSAWSYVFQWIVEMAATEFPVVVEAIEQWDGPEDVDMGGYAGNHSHVDEDLLALVERQYAQSAIAATLATADTSAETFRGIQRILVRIASLMDIESPQSDLASSAPLLPDMGPTLGISTSISLPHLSRSNLLQIDNPVTTPTESLLSLLNALTLSASILEKLGHGLPLVRVAELYLFGNVEDQRGVLKRILHGTSGSPRRDERTWRRLRHEIMWLWGWGADSKKANDNGRQDELGVLGKVGHEVLEIEMLKAMLNDTCCDLVAELYINVSDAERPATMAEIEKVVVESAMTSYDNASNGNKTRGGIKRASEAIATLYPNGIPKSNAVQRAEKLIAATHALSFYSLTLHHGVPFQPVNIRAHQDPIALLGKVLEQNPKSYTKLDDLLDIGRNLVDAGLPIIKHDGAVVGNSLTEQQLVQNAERRVTGMAIEAALAEDDFETAYSYVINRLVPPMPTASQTHLSSGCSAQDFSRNSDRQLDDVSWRAAFQAGRYRSANRPRPTASSTANPEIRHLEMRMELLAQSLLLAPAAALPEVLGVWRRSEEELNVLVAQESEEEQKWDDKGDKRVPGQFVSSSTTPIAKREGRANLKSGEEAPMGLFDVARGAAFALSKSAFPVGGTVVADKLQSSTKHKRVVGGPSVPSGDSGEADGDGRVRKRDTVSNMVAGGLASGIGWVLGMYLISPPDNTPAIRDERLTLTHTHTHTLGATPVHHHHHHHRPGEE